MRIAGGGRANFLHAHTYLQRACARRGCRVIRPVHKANDANIEVEHLVVINTLCADACGVANGDNSTCSDRCGIPNGDDSSCADACGVANGDGWTCADRCSVIYREYGACPVTFDAVLGLPCGLREVVGRIFYMLIHTCSVRVLGGVAELTNGAQTGREGQQREGTCWRRSDACRVNGWCADACRSKATGKRRAAKGRAAKGRAAKGRAAKGSGGQQREGTCWSRPTAGKGHAHSFAGV